MLARAIDEINELDPDVVVVSGDLTGEGFVNEYEQAADYLAQFTCQNVIVIPGNHDSRNVGYLHFEDLIGPRESSFHKDGLNIVAVDSSEPDQNGGRVGRGRYGWIKEEFEKDADLRVFVIHHHLMPIPGTGRERSVVMDAGDVLELITEAKVDIVLSGHKHVPYAWKLEDTFIVNAGTVSTTRLRGRGRPCYNVLHITPELVTIDQRYPYHGSERVISFDPLSRQFHKLDQHVTTEE
jgi:3',5'-cyclic AMP phosphodiesterase CpdA